MAVLARDHPEGASKWNLELQVPTPRRPVCNSPRKRCS